MRQKTRIKLRLSNRPVSYFYSLFGPWEESPPPDSTRIVFIPKFDAYFYERMCGRELRCQSYIKEEYEDS
jgi:hypothetical protein